MALLGKRRLSGRVKRVDEARDQLITQALDSLDALWGGAGGTGILDGLADANLLDLTVPQLCVLMFLRPGPQRIGRLAERLRTSLPSATSIANRMEQRGLIEREHDATDGRVVLCRLTQSGEETINILYKHQRALMASRFKSLSLGELGTVSHAFELMAKAVQHFSDTEAVMDSNHRPSG
jgi:DNA-binding MarR family transcriptional regulator